MESQTDEHRHARDDEPLNEPRPKKPLNGDSAIDVDMLEAAGGKLRPRSQPGAPDMCSTTAPGGAGRAGDVLSTNTGFWP